MSINRFCGCASGRNRFVEHAGFVCAVATAPGDATKQQTQNALAHLDESLKMPGSDKTCILQGQIFLADMTKKSSIDEVWNDRIGPDWQNWPQRACVGAPLASGTFV